MTTDPKAVTRAATEIMRLHNTAAACSLVAAHNRTPEALVLFNTPHLSHGQLKQMSESIFGSPVSQAQIGPLASCNARLGTYGFTFPQWRYLTQSFNGAALVEHFGMQKLKRDTDIADAALPDPQRDLFGTGFVRQKNGWYAEYRRAYVVCSNSAQQNAATFVIRNNSYFFGRDRLPAPVYVSFEKLSADELKNLTVDLLENSGKFSKWQETALDENKIRRATLTLSYLDRFDMELSDWLRSPDGLPHLLGFAQYKLTTIAPLPYIAEIDAHMPPWFPVSATALLEDAVFELKNKTAKTKTVLLTGANGDFPLKPETNSPPPASPFSSGARYPAP